MEDIALFKHTRSSIGTFLLDATLRELHVAESDVTENPVEIGAAVSDHSRPKPIRITLEGLVTASPLQPEPGKLRPSEVYQELLRTKDAGDVLTVVTPLATYENMVLESVSVTRDASTGDALPFTATLKQIKIATTASVIRPVEVAKPRAKAKQGLEEKPKAEAPNQPAPRTKPPRSMLSRATDSVATYFGE